IHLYIHNNLRNTAHAECMGGIQILTCSDFRPRLPSPIRSRETVKTATKSRQVQCISGARTQMVGTPFIKTIRINDRQTVELSSNSVLALVGANNAGKTYFLNLLRSHIHGATVQEISPNTDLFHAIEIGWRGTVNDAET